MTWVTRIGRLVGLVSGLAMAAAANAYPVGPAVSLEKMTDMADLVVKAKAIASEPAEDAWFSAVGGYKVQATKLEIISVLKGEPGAKTITFQHYAKGASGGSEFMPQHYEFAIGRSYVVFASKTDAPGIFRQLWRNHTTMEDQGVLRAANDRLRAGGSAKEWYWTELTETLASADADDVVYGIRHLDQMSGVGRMPLNDLGRAEVAEAIRHLVAAKDEKVATAAISAAGSGNPYMGDGEAAFWLLTVGQGHLPGLSRRDAKFDNLAGRLLWHDLAKVADGTGPAKVRALAVRALGRTGVAELAAALQRWAGDDEPLMRQAAVVLLADFPGDTASKCMQAAAGDASADVRQAAALAIGFAQVTPLVPLLAKLLKDDAASVREAAAMSLLSFSIDAAGEVLRANNQDPEYRALFVNALAAKDAAPYLLDLQEIIAKRPEPTHFWGGRIPAADSWDILFKYVQLRPAEEVRSGKLDTSLDALENMRWYSSSEPRDLYALYLQRGLSDRARTFRAACRKQVTYDIDYYFDMVDKSPDLYKRE